MGGFVPFPVAVTVGRSVLELRTSGGLDNDEVVSCRGGYHPRAGSRDLEPAIRRVQCPVATRARRIPASTQTRSRAPPTRARTQRPPCARRRIPCAAARREPACEEGRRVGDAQVRVARSGVGGVGWGSGLGLGASGRVGRDGRGRGHEARRGPMWTCGRGGYRGAPWRRGGGVNKTRSARVDIAAGLTRSGDGGRGRAALIEHASLRSRR